MRKVAAIHQLSRVRDCTCDSREVDFRTVTRGVSVRRVSLFRSPLILAVVTAVAILAVSAVPMSASAAKTRGGTVMAHQPTLGQEFRISTEPIRGGPDVVVGNAICLENAGTVCAAMTPTDWVDVITGSINAVASLIIIVKTLTGKGKGKHIERFDKDGTAHGRNQEGNGRCIGASGYNQDVTLRSCSSKHGVYWTLQSYNGGYRIWNTYAKGDLIAASKKSGDRLFIHSPEDWSTWKFEFCDGC
jgi:hypothetical protein